MTPAERQRLCRARGKGRHRGRYVTKAQFQQMLAIQSAAAPASPGDIAPRPAPAIVHPRFLHWLLAEGH